MKNLYCLLGLHKWVTVGVEEYCYKTDFWNQRIIRSLIFKCNKCGKGKLPKFYKKEFRLLHPYVDVHGFQKEWRPLYPELISNKGNKQLR